MGDGDLTEALARLDGFLGKGTRIGLLIDARGALGLAAEQRRTLIAHMRNNADKTARLLVQAIVNDNAIQRMLAFTVGVVAPPPFPSRSFGDVDAALSWLRAELDRG